MIDWPRRLEMFQYYADGHTYRELEERFGVTRERCRQLVKHAYMKLMKPENIPNPLPPYKGGYLIKGYSGYWQKSLDKVIDEKT
jgi:hypothetical protein